MVEQIRRHLFAAHAPALELHYSRAQRTVVEVEVELFLFGDGVGDDEPRAPETEVGQSLDQARHLTLALHGPVERATRIREVEAGEAAGAEADDGHSEGLEPLDGLRDLGPYLQAGPSAS